MKNTHRKQAEFAKLISEVRACVKCDRMAGSARVLNYSGGNLDAELFFVAEAPGRLGADETEVPLHGDTAGKNFEDLLGFASINRSDIYITNAVLCNPKDSEGNNATPAAAEIANCQPFLKRQIELVDPKIVVALGGVALRALSTIEPHGMSLGPRPTMRPWFGRWLIAIYHPGQRAMIHRSFANQRSDYQFVAEQWRRLGQRLRKSSGTTRSDVLAVARQLLASRASMSYFELHKLAYLTEYVHVRRCGRRLTTGYYIRQKDGPYCTDLEISRLKRADGAIKVVKERGNLALRLDETVASGLFSSAEVPAEVLAAVSEALARYGDKSDSDLKTAVYLTAPMRFLLRKERSAQTNLHNAPIDFLAAK